MKTKSVMIVGVGGQGSLLASRVLGHVFMAQGFDVKVSEVHGMSQRGGSVVTYIKYGDQVFSPIVEQGEADFLLSFEQLEAARWLPYLKKEGTMILSTQKIDPMPVITGTAQYPEDIVTKASADGCQSGRCRRFEFGSAGRFGESDKHRFNRHSLYYDALCKGTLGNCYSGIGSSQIFGF